MRLVTVILWNKGAHPVGTAVDIQGGFRWAGQEASSGGSFLSLMGCPASRTWEDQELAATQTGLINMNLAQKTLLYYFDLLSLLFPQHLSAQ